MHDKNFCVKKITVAIKESPLVCPFRIATGQHDSLKNVFLCLELNDGTKGYGEAAVATHITGETVEQTETNLNAIGSELPGKDISDYLNLSACLHERLPKNKSAVAALEMAILDALTRKWKIPLWRFFGSSPSKMESDITIVIAEADEAKTAIQNFYKQGFRKFKIKIGRDFDADFKRVQLVKQFAPKGKIYLDANQGYSAAQALDFLKQLEKFGIHPDMIEQPVHKNDFEGLRKITRLSKVDVCADESAGSFSDAAGLIHQRAVDVINIKLMKSALIESREIAMLTKAAGLKLMIGGMMESNLAVLAAAHFAAGLGGFDYIDMDTPFFVKGEVKKNPCLNSRGIYDLTKVKAGIGIVPKLRS
jgi:L-Ala-D/L-Glu epimerase